jgi:peptidoglycan/LPS O-acetylase OafA/YrhL
MFFVISGYIMFRVHKDAFGQARSWEFLAKRIVRVVPLYWILTTFELLILLFLVTLSESNTRIDPTWVAGSYLFFPVHHAPLDGMPLVPLGWTLNYEMYFYVVLSVCMIFKQSRALTILFGFLVTSVVLGVVIRPSGPLAMELTSWLLLEFLLGALIATAQHAFGDRWRRAHLLGLAVGLLLLVVGIPSGAHQGSLDRFLIWGLPYALVVNGACRLTLPPKARLVRLAVGIGDASYAIYLTQLFCQSAIQVALMRLGLIDAIPLDVGVLIFVLTSIAGGWLTWRAIEAPVTFWLRTGLNLALASLPSANRPQAGQTSSATSSG